MLHDVGFALHPVLHQFTGLGFGGWLGFLTAQLPVPKADSYKLAVLKHARTAGALRGKRRKELLHAPWPKVGGQAKRDYLGVRYLVAEVGLAV